MVVLPLWSALPLLGALSCSGEKLLPAGDASRPDVVLISVDTLRADHLSSYGYDRQTSPFFDRLAKDGTRFAHARSASPWTLPGHLTLLSGQLPATHKVVDDNLRLDPETPLLPEVMQKAGWTTGGFVSTLYVSSLFGFERGFDRFEDFDIHTEKKNLSGEVVAEKVVDEALAWWSSVEPSKPVFLFIHLYDAHYAYDPPAPYETAFDRAPVKGDARYKNYFHFKKKPIDDEQMAHQVAQYDESILYLNDQLERLDKAATAAGRNVRWVITSDHGEEFGERGSWGHAHTLYAEQLHIPLIVSGPGIEAGKVVSDAVGSHDVAPTIAGWAGQSGLEPDGQDLAGLMAGQSLDSRLFLAETTRFKTNRLGVYDGASGLRLEWDLKRNKKQLFLPGEDPREANDLAKQRKEEVTLLQERLVEVLGMPWEAVAAGKVETDGFVLTGAGRSRKKDVEVGDRFVVLPYDAAVRFTPAGGAVQGPFHAAGGVLPGDDNGLRYNAHSGASSAVLDEETRKALEALGYMQQ